MAATRAMRTRALLLAGLLLIPGLQGCEGKDVMKLMQTLHPYIGKMIGSDKAKDKSKDGEKKAKAEDAKAADAGKKDEASKEASKDPKAPDAARGDTSRAESESDANQDEDALKGAN